MNNMQQFFPNPYGEVQSSDYVHMQTPDYENVQSSAYGHLQSSGFGNVQLSGYGHIQPIDFGNAQLSGFENAQTLGYGNQLTSGYGNQQTSGYGNQQASDYGNQLTSDYENQPTSGYGNQMTSGHGNQQIFDYGNQLTSGYENQQTSGYGNQQTSSYGNQQTSGYGNQQTTDNGNQQTSGYGQLQPLDIGQVDISDYGQGHTSDYGQGHLSNYEHAQISYYDPYILAELQKARNMLIQQVNYGCLQWLNNKLRQNLLNYDKRAMVPNVWEGEDGMMEHVHKPFPMPPPPCSCQEESNTEPNASAWMAPGSAPEQSYEDWTEDYSEMSTSWNLRGTYTGAQISGIFGDMPVEDNGFGERVHKKAQERMFWIRMTKMFRKLDNTNLSLKRTKSGIYNGDQDTLTRACQQLANLHRRLKLIKEELVKEKEEFETCKYRNIFKILPFDQRRRFIRQHRLKGNLPSKVGYVVSKCEKLRIKIREILLAQAERLEPHRDILQEAFEDFAAETCEDDQSLHSESENEDNDNTGGLEVDSYNNIDSIKKRATNSDKIHSQDMTKNGDVSISSKSASLSKKGNIVQNHQLRADVKGNSVETVERHCDDINLLESSAETAGSFERPDAKLDCSKYTEEDMFWNNLTTLRREICDAVTRAHKVTTKTPKKHAQEKFTKSDCEHLVSLHKRIVLFDSSLSKFEDEMETKKYVERGPYGLDDLRRQKLQQLRSACSSIDVVKALLNNLKSLYMKVRSEKYNILLKFEFITDPGDLIFNVEEVDKTVRRVCAHSEAQINMAAVCSEESSDSSAPNCKHSENDNDFLSHEANSKNLSEDTSINSKATSDHSKDKAEFLEKEKEHWIRLQKLFKKIDRSIRNFRNKSRKVWLGEERMQIIMDAAQNQLTKLSKQFATEKSESSDAGYCKEVSYINTECHPQISLRLLVKSLDQVKSRIDDFYDLFIAAARKMGLHHLYNM